MQALKFGIFIGNLILFSSVQAQIVLRDAKDAPVPIAIQSFVQLPESPEMSKIATDVEAALTADLIFSRIFRVIPAEAFLESKITGPIDVLNVTSWRQVGAQYVVRGRVSTTGSQITLEGFAFNISTGKQEIKKNYRSSKSNSKILAHMFGDDLVELVTGKKGLFSTKIAFSYMPPKKRIKEIWTVDFNGSGAKPIVQNGRSNISPEWTIDGKFIYYTSSSNIDWHLWKSNLDGRQSQITKFKGSALGPAMLANGRELVITLSKDGNPDLYLLDLDGRVQKRLTTKRGINIGPSPSPDGKHVCFASDRLGNLHIFMLNVETGDAERLTRVGTLNDSCAWNPSEDQVLFSGMDADREFDVFSMDSRGNNMERLTYDAKNNESPSWSPDGKLVVFSSRREGKNRLYVMKADGTQASLLMDLPGDATQPTWSPRLGYR